MAFATDRNLCSCEEAAKIYGCSMSRIRQLAREKAIWSKKLGYRSYVYDADQVRQLAAAVAKKREAGKLGGKPPKGFSAA